MSRKSNRHNPYPPQREGFWKHPRERKCPLPVPVALDKAWPGKKKFLKKLRLLERKIRKQTPAFVKACKGQSPCRLCRKRNGSEEFTDPGNGWVWPSGFAHYVEKHNVRPSLAFQEFVTGGQVNTCN